MMTTPSVPDFTVVICTYNGAERLPALLQKLRSQQQTLAFIWEVLVIDNNSTDATPTVVQQFQQQWRPDVPLRYCIEPRQGIAFARRCGLRHTTSPLLGFLDDDTLPAPNWVEAAYHFGQQHPQAGAYGGINRALHEVPPPPGFHRIASLLAIVERGDRPFIYDRQRKVLPGGAGMVVRRTAWQATVPDEPILAGVYKAALSSKGEDVETLSYIREGGWQIWYNPEMQLEHYLPARRTERTYLIHLSCSVGLNRFPLRMVRWPMWQRPFLIPLYFLSDLRRLVMYGIKNYRQLLAGGDVICACEWTLLSSTLWSPWHHLRILRLRSSAPSPAEQYWLDHQPHSPHV